MDKKTTKWLNISCIKIIDTYPLNARTLDLAMKLKNNIILPDDLPPITTYCDCNGVHQIKDGRHRYVAFRLCGIDYIKANISKPKHI